LKLKPANPATASPSPAAFTHPTTSIVTSFQGRVLARTAQESHIVDATIARQLFEKTEVTFRQITAALGNSEASAFTRTIWR
jgi:hypothetical protein